MPRALATASAALALLLATGCLPRPHLRQPASTSRWPRMLDSALGLASAKRFDDASRLLEQFAGRYPGTAEATETLYWRGVLLLDPANRGSSFKSAAASFDLYLAAGRPVAHGVEANSLLRLASRVDALLSIATAPAATKEPAAGGGSSGGGGGGGASAAIERATERATELTASLRARDTEIQRLRDSLTKATDELDRIKRRLSAPKP